MVFQDFMLPFDIGGGFAEEGDAGTFGKAGAFDEGLPVCRKDWGILPSFLAVESPEFGIEEVEISHNEFILSFADRGSGSGLCG